jgi:sugar transferase (PEP-CTERM system associated)
MRVRVLGQHVPLPLGVLAVTEGALAFLTLYAAALIRFETPLSHVSNLERELGPLWPRALVFCFIVMTCLLAFGLYSSRQRAALAGVFVRLIAALAVTGFAIAAVFYLVPSMHLWRGVPALALLGTGCAVLLSRIVFTRIVDQEIFKRRVLVYGSGTAATSVARLRRSSDRRGFQVVGFVRAPGEDPTENPFIHAERLLNPAGDLAALCDRLNAGEVVVAMDDRRLGFPIRELLDCRLAGVEVTEVLTFLEREAGMVRIDMLNPSWMIFGEGFRRDPLRLFSSRALDLVAGIGVLAVSLPVMLLTALAIKLEDWRAPVFYAQIRVGLGGRLFRLLKFRSMHEDAESNGAQWAQSRDPRVTRVGAVIRKLRFDELPQVFNVLWGQMSFVGPRPERPEFVEHLAEKIPYYVQRHCVKPGITGWAQLCYPYGSSAQDALEKLQYDLYYIKNNSLLFDLAILLQTAEVVLLGKGAR